MPTVDERLGLLEGRVQDHHGALVEIRDAIRDLRGDMMDRFTQNDEHLARIEGRFTQVDARFTQIDARFTQIDARFTQIDGRFIGIDGRFLGIEGRIDRLDEKIDRHFLWLLGIEMASLLTVVGALAAALSR